MKRDDNRVLWVSTVGSSLAKMVIEVQHNNACLKNCEEKAGVGLHASQVTWRRAAQE